MSKQQKQEVETMSELVYAAKESLVLGLSYQQALKFIMRNAKVDKRTAQEVYDYYRASSYE